ncbi:glycosyltransferase [Priestia aryabhattai]|uniref:glycosyltransferase n=1 Tax=Priestia aryabhattai TaxID=412384 RepID=UPI003D2DD671
MISKIKILHLLQSGHFSGAENVACKIIDMFNQDENIEMAYCSKVGQISDVLNQRGIKFHPMSKLCKTEVRKVIKTFRPDIIHAHDASASVIAASCTSKIPIVSHLHSNPPWIKKLGLNSLIYLISCMKYKNVLTVSNSIMEEYIFGRYIKKKTQIIGNPVDLKEIKHKAEKGYDHKYDITFIGRLSKEKDPLRFINLIYEIKKSIPNIKVAIVGQGYLESDCKSLINRLELNDSIDLKGFLSNPYPLLSNSKILCITSKWEGFGLVAMEAMTLGCPVICTPVGGLPMLVNEYCGSMCEKDEEFVIELQKLLGDKQVLREKSQGAIKQAYNLENIDIYKQTLDNIYKNIIGEMSNYA